MWIGGLEFGNQTTPHKLPRPFGNDITGRSSLLVRTDSQHFGKMSVNNKHAKESTFVSGALAASPLGLRDLGVSCPS